MNFELEKKWRGLQDKLGEKTGEPPELDSILFVIGLQELNMDVKKLSKDQKIEVMHIGLCVIFTTQGYYKPKGRDKDGWIHFEELHVLYQTFQMNQQSKILILEKNLL